MSWRRRGSAKYGRASSSSMVVRRLEESVRGEAASESSATWAICSAVHLPESSPNRACRPPSTRRRAPAGPRCTDRSAAQALCVARRPRTCRSRKPERCPPPPVRILMYASYRAHAASISTCDSLIGGTAPMESIAERTENAPAGKVIRRTRDAEPDVGLLEAEVGVQLGETRHEHLDTVGGAFGAALVRSMGKADNGYISHGIPYWWCCRCRSRRRAHPSAGSSRCCRCRGPIPRGASTPPRPACPSARRPRRSR